MPILTHDIPATGEDLFNDSGKIARGARGMNCPPDLLIDQAIENRNKSWQNNPLVPSWVDIDSVDLDQFFTKLDIAEYCTNSLLTKMENDGAINQDYVFIEPAAGGCTFYNILPPTRRIGVDILPLQDDLVEADFLSWNPKESAKYAVIGNPPFGYRGWLALAFINHAAKFADYVGLILPMSFQSAGKGSPKFRVEGLRLLHSEILPQDSFTDVKGKTLKVNTIWQVWQRGVNNHRQAPACSEWLDIFTVDMRKERLCGQERLADADFFLQRTYYNKPPSLVKDFAEVKYVCGYGLIIKKERQKIIKLLRHADWYNYSNLAAHNCRHISMYHINQVLIDAGFVNA